MFLLRSTKTGGAIRNEERKPASCRLLEKKKIWHSLLPETLMCPIRTTILTSPPLSSLPAAQLSWSPIGPARQGVPFIRPWSAPTKEPMKRRFCQVPGWLSPQSWVVLLESSKKDQGRRVLPLSTALFVVVPEGQTFWSRWLWRHDHGVQKPLKIKTLEQSV